MVDVKASLPETSSFFISPNVCSAQLLFSVYIVLEMYNLGLNKNNVASLLDRPFVRDFEKKPEEKKIPAKVNSN